MTPQERELITSLLGRLKQAAGQPKDAEAEALIRQAVSEQSDITYYLVQTAIIQDIALKNAEGKIAALERQVAAAASAPKPATSFLGGLFGGSRPAPAQAPAPAPAPTAGGPWGRPAAAYQPPPPQYAPQPQYAAPASSGGGFLQQAAATAAGVAGGALLFQGIESMIGGGHHGGFGGAGYGGGTPIEENVTETTVVNNYYGNPPDQGGGDYAADTGASGTGEDDVADADYSGDADFGGGDDYV